MPEGRDRHLRKQSFEWVARIVDSLSLIEFVYRWFWSPVGGSAVVTIMAVVTGVLRWFGLPLRQAAIIGLCFVIAVVLAVFFGIWISRLRRGRLAGPEVFLQSSESPSEYADKSEYRGTAQGIVLVILLVGLVYVYSLLYEIQREAECYLFPRRLTSAQRVTIADYLKKYDAYDITLMLPAIDNEVALYASDFERAFTNGDWKVKREVLPLPPDGSFPKRVMSLSYISNEKTRREYDERLGRGPPHPGKVASAALEGLGISYSDGEDPKLEDGVHKIVLIIGPRPYSLCRGNTDRKK